ncbi:hypothetical protein [Pleomorphovibrio marinus]|uniref:hypothetical protein n=1 Tax=Pleomorphovibrio marinus TaxID=2164132 RepID=UPI000E0A1D88|nr:hypothetical protein [Pleomorphovibrio marinus]
MKKLMLSLAVCGMFGFTAIQANALVLPANTDSIYQDDEKIDPDDLPEQVKESIKKDDKMNKKKISEARTERKDNQMYYVVKFEKDDDGEEVTKKFDAMGKEAKEGAQHQQQRPAGQQTSPAQGTPQQQPQQQGTPGTNRPNL